MKACEDGESEADQEQGQEQEQEQEQKEHSGRSPSVTTEPDDAITQPGQDIGSERVQPQTLRQPSNRLYLDSRLFSALDWISYLWTGLLAMISSLFFGSAVPTGQRHGHRPFRLVQEFPDAEDEDATSSAEVDIIVLPGLLAHAPTTFEAWTNGEDAFNGCVNWLKDSHMLPSRFPKARVLTYNWQSNYKGPKSSVRFDETVNSFLGDIYEERKRTERLKMPIVFIASCFGGLLLAKALVRAIESAQPRQHEYKQIAFWTIGAIFLGTPFRGSWEFGTENARKQLAFAKDNNIEVSQELVDYLRPHNRNDASDNLSPLNATVRRFLEIQRDRGFQIPAVCFYETRPTDPAAFSKNLPRSYRSSLLARNPELAVPEESAIIDGIEAVPVDCRHNMLWKFNSPRNEAFVQICGRIEDFVNQSADLMETKAKHPGNADLILLSHIKEHLRVELGGKERYNEYEKQRATFRDRQPDTCLSFLRFESFLGWCENPGASTLLCLGDAGAGKTVFASVAIDHLRELVKKRRKSALAYLYCEYSFEKISSHASLSSRPRQARALTGNYLRCMLRQLLSACSRVDDTMETMFQSWKEEKRQPDDEECAAALKRVAKYFSQVYIVVDALDECSPGVRMQLLQTLTDLQNTSGVNLHVMMTSRFDIIQETVRNFQSVEEMEIRATEADIKLYLETEICRIPGYLKTRCGVAMKQTIVKTITETADGMFLLAHLQISSLALKTTDREIETALQNFDKAFHSSLNKPSAERRSQRNVRDIYAKAYNETLERINSQPQEIRERVKRALSWILHSRQSLTIPQFETVLGFPIELDSMLSREDIDPKPFQGVQVFCAGLIKEEDHRVRFIHYTTQQYLYDHISDINSTSHHETGILQTPSNQNVPNDDTGTPEHLLLSCIAYLALNNFSTFRIKILGKGVDKTDLFYNYAVKNWAGYVLELDLKFLENTLAREIFLRFFSDDAKILLAIRHQWKSHRLIARQLQPHYSPMGRMSPGLPLHVLWPLKTHLALHFTIHCGRPDIAKMLLSLSSRPSKYHIGTVTELLCSIDNMRYTPLCWAARRGDCKMLELFLDPKYKDAVNLGHLSENGKPLELAAQSESRKAVHMLLEHTSDGAEDAMLVAVAKNDESLVKIMLHRKLDPNMEASSRVKDFLFEPGPNLAAIKVPRILASEMKRREIMALFDDRDSGTIRPLYDSDFKDFRYDGNSLLHLRMAFSVHES